MQLWFYSELPPNDWDEHILPRKLIFASFTRDLLFFCLNPELVTIHSLNVDGLGSLELHPPAQFPLLVQRPHYSWCRTSPSVHLKLYFCTICKRDLMILKLLGATAVTSNPDRAIYPFQQRTMVFGLERQILISAASPSAANCSSACWRSQTDEPKRIISSAKSSEMNSEVHNSLRPSCNLRFWISEYRKRVFAKGKLSSLSSWVTRLLEKRLNLCQECETALTLVSQSLTRRHLNFLWFWKTFKVSSFVFPFQAPPK